MAPLVTLLAGCGDYPRPFAGHPGTEAERLVRPPPARLAVAPPTTAMLSDIGADTYAGTLVDQLNSSEVPATLDRPRRGDWSLVLGADLKGGKVVPSYEIDDPAGTSMGVSEGAPVDPAAWANADPPTLRQTAAAAAPTIISLLRSIDAAQKRSDPNSLLNRPARIVIAGVTGAPGDGNAALVREMRRKLPDLGEVVQDTPAGADFALSAKVAVEAEPGGKQRVEIQWIVADAGGEERGRIVQLNEVPPGTLDHYWGDVAVAVVAEAAGGVKDVILNFSGAHK